MVGATIPFELHIWSQFLAPDGVGLEPRFGSRDAGRLSVLINNTFPGPTLRVTCVMLSTVAFLPFTQS